MVKIKQQLVASRAKTYAGKNPCNYITIHETANTSRGANAQAHANLQSNGFSASWHYQVDDKQIIQSFPDNVQCWHAGDGQGKGNTQSIGVEICVNRDGNFKQAVENAAELVKILMDRHGISAKNVVQHNHWSGKNCPANLRSGTKGINWNDFKGMLTGKVKSVSQPKPATKTNSTGGSIVDYLKANGINSSFANRKKLATKHGIKNYKGTAAQNTQLLNQLKGNKVKQSAPKKKYSLPKGVLRIGSRGNDVKQVQRALNAANFNVGKVDGIYGPKTKDGVTRFQKVHDAYNVDGIYGSRTRSRLDKVVN